MKIHFSPNILFIIPADTTKKQFYTCDIQGRTGGGTECMCPPYVWLPGALPVQCNQCAMDPARFMQQM